jgi:hypothetical protein
MSDPLTEKIIGAAIEVHRISGPGLINFGEKRLVDGVRRLSL